MNAQRVPLQQRRDLSQIIGAATSLYLQNFWPLFGIAAAVVPLGIAAAAFQATADESWSILAVVVGLSVLQFAVTLLVGAALIAGLADIEAGRPANFSRAYDIAFERFWTLVGAILRVVGIVLGLAVTIIGIPWAIQRAVRWLFVQQAVILDGTSARAALIYSADAVTGQWWRTLGISVVIGIIAALPPSVVAGVFFLAPPVLSGAVGSIANAALLPFAATAMTMLYYDLRLRKEPGVAPGSSAAQDEMEVP